MRSVREVLDYVWGVFTTRPELVGTFGMVASTHWLASAVGMAVLEDGGNAFDAVVAAGFVLQVVEPHLNGPGGEVPVVFATVEDRRRASYVGRVWLRRRRPWSITQGSGWTWCRALGCWRRPCRGRGMRG